MFILINTHVYTVKHIHKNVNTYNQHMHNLSVTCEIGLLKEFSRFLAWVLNSPFGSSGMGLNFISTSEDGSRIGIN